MYFEVIVILIIYFIGCLKCIKISKYPPILKPIFSIKEHSIEKSEVYLDLWLKSDNIFKAR